MKLDIDRIQRDWDFLRRTRGPEHAEARIHAALPDLLAEIKRLRQSRGVDLVAYDAAIGLLRTIAEQCVSIPLRDPDASIVPAFLMYAIKKFLADQE